MNVREQIVTFLREKARRLQEQSGGSEHIELVAATTRDNALMIEQGDDEPEGESKHKKALALSVAEAGAELMNRGMPAGTPRAVVRDRRVAPDFGKVTPDEVAMLLRALREFRVMRDRALARHEAEKKKGDTE